MSEKSGDDQSSPQSISDQPLDDMESVGGEASTPVPLCVQCHVSRGRPCLFTSGSGCCAFVASKNG